MRELSLFSGAGGGLLGTKLLGWTHVGYVEWNEYCQRVIAARIADGYLDNAPIFTDVREFAQSGAADQYRGIADVVSAGFPCQPFSVAGKQAGADDERNMWPATIEVIRRVQPESVLLENVPGLISCGYLGTVITGLAEAGYVGRWGVLGARDVGAPHQRNRLWIVAHSKGKRSDGSAYHRGGDCKHVLEVSESGNGRNDADVADSSCERFKEQHATTSSGEPKQRSRGAVAWWLCDPGDGPESGVGRVVDGVACRMDRLKAAGNGQVSAVVARAWEFLA